MQRAVQLGEDRLVGAVAAGQPRQVVQAEVVLRRRRVAPVRLEQADRVGPHVGPVALARAVRLDVRVEALVPVRVRHRQVPGQQVEQRRDVAGALDARVAAQRQDAAAGPADVAQEQLEDGRAADVLHADGVLRPAHRVAEGRGAVPAAVAQEQVRDLRELLLGHAAHLLDHLRGVPGEVPGEDVDDAAGVLQRLVALRFAVQRGARRSRATRGGRPRRPTRPSLVRSWYWASRSPEALATSAPS